MVFVLVEAVQGLTAASIALAVTAATVFVVQLWRGRSVRATVLGLLAAAACGVVAVLVGEARAFFLLPTLFPVGLVLVLGVSLLVGRPFTGVLLNGLAGGPGDWYQDRSLMRVYVVTTWIAIVVSVVNFTLRAAAYAADEVAVLTVVGVVAAPVALALAAGTVAAARPAAVLARARTTASSSEGP